MRSLRRRIHAQIVLLLAAATVLGTTGCRSGIFKKSEQAWKMPDMSGLAFWKKGDSNAIPPPPAHHFTPADSSGQVARTQIAAKQSPSGDFDDGVSALTNSVKTAANDAEARVSEKEKAISEKVASEIAAKTSNQPLRKPYEVPVDPVVMKAQTDFNAAVAGTKQAVKEGLKPAVGDSVAATTASATQAANQFVNDFQPPRAIPGTSFEKLNLPSTGDLQNKVAATQNSLASVQTAINRDPQLTEVQLEIERAKKEIAALKQQLAETQKTASGAAAKALAPISEVGITSVNKAAQLMPITAQATNPPTNQAVQLAVQPVVNFSPLDQMASSTSENAASNLLRSSGGEFNQTPQQPVSAPPTTPAFGGYPSTPHSSYAPLTSATASSSNTTGTRVAAANHVSEVEIPESVLRGSGSYAPGSVNQLRQY